MDKLPEKLKIFTNYKFNVPLEFFLHKISKKDDYLRYIKKGYLTEVVNENEIFFVISKKYEKPVYENLSQYSRLFYDYYKSRLKKTEYMTYMEYVSNKVSIYNYLSFCLKTQKNRECIEFLRDNIFKIYKWDNTSLAETMFKKTSTERLINKVIRLMDDTKNVIKLLGDDGTEEEDIIQNTTKLSMQYERKRLSEEEYCYLMYKNVTLKRYDDDFRKYVKNEFANINNEFSRFYLSIMNEDFNITTNNADELADPFYYYIQQLEILWKVCTRNKRTEIDPDEFANIAVACISYAHTLDKPDNNIFARLVIFFLLQLQRREETRIPDFMSSLLNKISDYGHDDGHNLLMNLNNQIVRKSHVEPYNGKYKAIYDVFVGFISNIE